MIQEAAPLKVISLGAGAQSSAMALWAQEGRFGPMPDFAVFADTQWEPKAVYEWLERLEKEITAFPIIRVSKANIRDMALRGSSDSGRFVTIPYYLKHPDGSSGMGRRQCSSEYKIEMLQKFAREHGASRKNPCEQLIGISLDECHRMKPSRVLYMVNKYPLVDERITREDCQNYLVKRMGSKAPKSACIGCPYHGDDYWIDLRDNSPEEFADAVEFDRQIRGGVWTDEPVFTAKQLRRLDEIKHQLWEMEDEYEQQGDDLGRNRIAAKMDALEVERDAIKPGKTVGKMRAEQYIHRSLVPLGDIKEFRHEKQGRMFFDGFGNECEGMCGL